MGLTQDWSACPPVVGYTPRDLVPNLNLPAAHCLNSNLSGSDFGVKPVTSNGIEKRRNKYVSVTGISDLIPPKRVISILVPNFSRLKIARHIFHKYIPGVIRTLHGTSRH